MPTEVLTPSQPRRSSVSQKLAQVFRRNTSDSAPASGGVGAPVERKKSNSPPPTNASSASDGKQVEMEGSSALERMPSPLEQGNALLASYKHAPALELYAAAIASIPSPPCSTATMADPLASTSTSAMSTSPTSAGAFIPTDAETIELHLNHSLCRLKVGHYAIAQSDSAKALTLLEEKETKAGGLDEKEKKMRKKAKWVEQMAVEGQKWEQNLGSAPTPF